MSYHTFLSTNFYGQPLSDLDKLWPVISEVIRDTNFLYQKAAKGIKLDLKHAELVAANPLILESIKDFGKFYKIIISGGRSTDSQMKIKARKNQTIGWLVLELERLINSYEPIELLMDE